MREWLADRFVGNLEVELSRNSTCSHRVFGAGRGRLGARRQRLAEAYIQTTIELKLDPAKRQSRWFDEQLLACACPGEESQQRLADFQRKNTLVTTDGRIDVETTARRYRHRSTCPPRPR